MAMIHELEISFRRESARIVASLTRTFGPARLALAEDVAQETFLRALRVWSAKGVPPEPAAWLHRVARNLALDVLRREGLYHPQALAEHLVVTAPEFDNVLADDELRMLFLCSHPSLPVESQIALTLNTLGGLSAKEIAHGLLAKESAIAQRIVRAKRLLQESQATFEMPSANELPARKEAVLKVLYLLFNEGYKASHGPDLTRDDLCHEAILLTNRLANHPGPPDPAVHALLALMLLQASRLPTRTNEVGELCLLEDQDRGQWDLDLIQAGLRHLALAANGDRMTVYHCEAAIAAAHATAPSLTNTDWEAVVEAYGDLNRIAPSPVVGLNRAVALSMLRGPAVGLEEIQKIESDPRLAHYHLLWAAQGSMLERLGRYSEAECAYGKAMPLTQNEAERSLLNERRQGLRVLF
jgi:RNA polymerase sigma-70 factor (ECF subfamily)